MKISSAHTYGNQSNSIALNKESPNNRIDRYHTPVDTMYEFHRKEVDRIRTKLHTITSLSVSNLPNMYMYKPFRIMECQRAKPQQYLLSTILSHKYFAVQTTIQYIPIKLTRNHIPIYGTRKQNQKQKKIHRQATQVDSINNPIITPKYQTRVTQNILNKSRG